MKGAFLHSKKTVVVLAALFFVGVLFYCLSEYHIGEEATGETTLFDEAAYEARVEEKLRNMIAAVCRDENVHVLVMLEGSAVYCYEKETTKSDSYAETSLLFRSDQSGNKTPVLTRIEAPEIRGVSVVCPGGSDPGRRREIIALISGALHLASNRIYVPE